MDEAKRLAYIREKFERDKGKKIKRIQLIGETAYIVDFDDGAQAVGSVPEGATRETPMKLVISDLKDDLKTDQLRQDLEKPDIEDRPITEEERVEILRMINPMMQKYSYDEEDE